MKKILTALILGVATASFVSVSTPAYSQISKKKKIIKKSNSFKKGRSIKKSRTSRLKGHSKFGKSIILKKKLNRFDDEYYKDQYYKYDNLYYKYDLFDDGFRGHSKFGGRRSFGSRGRFGTGRLGGFGGSSKGLKRKSKVLRKGF